MLIRNLFRYWTYRVFSPETVLREKYLSFKALLEHDRQAHELLAALEEIYYNRKKCDLQVVVKTYERFARAVSAMVEELLKMCPNDHRSLREYHKRFDAYIRHMLVPPRPDESPPFTVELGDVALSEEKIVGKKAFNLSRLGRELHLPVPEGFVITTSAFHHFLSFNDLQGPINERLAELDIADPESLDRAAGEIEALILNGDVPPEVASAVGEALELLEKTCGGPVRTALRSSAVKEDGKASFAGQYRTLLNVERGDLLDGYKKVMAGKYASRALFYRIGRGILDSEASMAVLVLGMIDAAASGVMYTRDPRAPASGNVLIHSIWGQGELLVEGKASPDVIRVDRDNPDRVVPVKTPSKVKEMILDSRRGTRIRRMEPSLGNRVSIDDLAARTLAGWGVSLEARFGCPLDVEWCRDRSGRLYILQARPLNAELPPGREAASEPVSGENRILCSGGETIFPGTCTGPVYRLIPPAGPERIPDGAVVVVRHARPRLVTAVERMAGVIVATGSIAGHFSSIAREFGVPSMVNAEEGFGKLVNGETVTLDARGGVVYEGVVPLPEVKAAVGEDYFSDSAFTALLGFVIDFAAKLKLTDPESRDFTPEGCRSLHDIVRFAHETAVREMFFLGSRKGGRKMGARKLASGVPMGLYVLDVGGGIRKGQGGEETVGEDDVAHTPLEPVLKGLSHPGICWSEGDHFDWGEYDRIVAGGGIVSPDSPMFASYAVLSPTYLNVNFRFGYHFVILDTLMEEDRENNYILFRFSGGGGSPRARRLRADFITGVLARLEFTTRGKSDLVDGEFKNASPEEMERLLEMTGRLLGATKLMDMYMEEAPDINAMVNDFMNGRYDFRRVVSETAPGAEGAP